MLIGFDLPGRIVPVVQGFVLKVKDEYWNSVYIRITWNIDIIQ